MATVLYQLRYTSARNHKKLAAIPYCRLDLGKSLSFV